MVAVEETKDHVVFCCRRCTEITHVAVIQVRTLKYGKEKAAYQVAQQRKNMDPKLLEMLMSRKRGAVRYREMEKSNA